MLAIEIPLDEAIGTVRKLKRKNCIHVRLRKTRLVAVDHDGVNDKGCVQEVQRVEITHFTLNVYTVETTRL